MSQQEDKQENEKKVFSVNEQVESINTELNSEISELDKRIETIKNEFKNNENPYDALIASQKKTQVTDPKRERAARTMSTLYDALQIIGSFAGMGGFSGGRSATPAAPQLASATGIYNTYRNKREAEQQQADSSYTNTVNRLKQLQQEWNDREKNRYDVLLSDIEKQKKDAKHRANTRIDRIHEDERNRQAALERLKEELKSKKELQASKTPKRTTVEYIPSY